MPSDNANITLELQWSSDHADHRDAVYLPKANFWRDVYPPGLEALKGLPPGATAVAEIAEWDSIPPRSADKVVRVRPEQFNRQFLRGMQLQPEAGRIYPIGILQGLPGYFAGDYRPALCIERAAEHLRFDLNHPLAGRKLRLSGRLIAFEAAQDERGGRCNDWVEAVTEKGPGMQARDTDRPPTEWPADAFERPDASADERFYNMTRTLPHIDATASGVIADLLREKLPAGGRLLDLMSSCQSHLPQDTAFAEVVGLGMNTEELALNPRLTEHLRQDLNADPALPFDTARFDAVVCNLSVEYLIDPISVFRETARVLRPGGIFVVTFSNRWFPPKAIKLWTLMHEFERLGLVLDLFLRTEAFEQLGSYSMRGLPRPQDDKYAAQTPVSDPVFAAWGRQPGGGDSQ